MVDRKPLSPYLLHWLFTDAELVTDKRVSTEFQEEEHSSRGTATPLRLSFQFSLPNITTQSLYYKSSPLLCRLVPQKFHQNIGSTISILGTCRRKWRFKSRCLMNWFQNRISCWRWSPPWPDQGGPALDGLSSVSIFGGLFLKGARICPLLYLDMWEYVSKCWPLPAPASIFHGSAYLNWQFCCWKCVRFRWLVR